MKRYLETSEAHFLKTNKDIKVILRENNLNNDTRTLDEEHRYALYCFALRENRKLCKDVKPLGDPLDVKTSLAIMLKPLTNDGSFAYHLV